MLARHRRRHDDGDPDPRHRSLGRRGHRAHRRGRRAAASRSSACPRPSRSLAALAVGAAIGAWHGFWVGWLGIPAFIVDARRIQGVSRRARSCSRMRAGCRRWATTSASSAARCRVARPGRSSLGALALGLALIAARRRAPQGARPRAARRPRRVALRASPARSCSPRLLLAVFGTDGMPVPVLVAGARRARRRVRHAAHALRPPRLRDRRQPRGRAPLRHRVEGATIGGLHRSSACSPRSPASSLAARTNGVTPGNQGNAARAPRRHRGRHRRHVLTGGRGTIVGTVLGALVFATLANGMNLLGIDSNWQLIFTGTILLGAVAASTSSRKARRS